MRKLLRKFAIPCIFSLMISCLYNIVDQIFVGNGVGYLGNAATVIFPVTVIGAGRKSIARSDAARGAYHKSVSGRNWGDPHRYKLSLDSSIGVEKTAAIILEYLK